MQGMFRANGGCGYVKKPDFLMNVGPSGKVFDPNENASPKKILKVGYRTSVWFLLLCLHSFFGLTFEKMAGESLYGRWMAPRLQKNSL